MSDGLLGAYSIDTEIERFRPDDTGAGRRAETLIKVDGLRVVLVTMRAGISLHEHVAPGPITIHALRGRFRGASGSACRRGSRPAMAGVGL